MSNEIYREYAIAQLKKIGAKINGHIRFELYPDNDIVMFRTECKGFTYNHVFSGIQERMYSGNDEAISEFLKGYEAALHRCFYRSEVRQYGERQFVPRENKFSTHKKGYWIDHSERHEERNS